MWPDLLQLRAKAQGGCGLQPKQVTKVAKRVGRLLFSGTWKASRKLGVARGSLFPGYSTSVAALHLSGAMQIVWLAGL